MTSVYLCCKAYESVDIQRRLREVEDELYVVGQGKVIRCSW